LAKEFDALACRVSQRLRADLGRATQIVSPKIQNVSPLLEAMREAARNQEPGRLGVWLFGLAAWGSFWFLLLLQFGPYYLALFRQAYETAAHGAAFAPLSSFQGLGVFGRALLTVAPATLLAGVCLSWAGGTRRIRRAAAAMRRESAKALAAGEVSIAWPDPTVAALETLLSLEPTEKSVAADEARE